VTTRPADVPTAYDFAAVFDHAGLGLVIADDAGRILRVNAAFARLVGREPSELIGRDSAHFTHPDDRPLSIDSIEHVESGQQPTHSFEKRYVRPDGEIVWARISLASAYDDESGRYLIGTAEDITEQKRTREELADARRRVDSALIAAEVGTYEWEVTSDRLWGDANFDRIFGTTRNEDGTAPLARFVEAIHPDDRERVMRDVMRTVETGADYDIEYRVINAGVERWVSARGRLAPADERGVVRFHGMVLDISARKRVEHELQRRSAIYDAFLSSTDDLAYLIDRDGRFIFANRALLKLWGMTMDEVHGKTLYELGYPKWHADMNMREFAQVFETRRTIQGEVPYLSPTGVHGVYEYVFSPVLDARGDVELIAGTSRDVADRRQAAEAQKRLADQLRLALEAAHMGWWQLDPATRRMFLDARTSAIFGIAPGDHDYAAILDRLAGDDARRIDAAIAAAIDPATSAPYEVEYRVQTSDGTIRWVVSKGLPIFEGEGDTRRVVNFVGTALDVTDAKKAEQAVQTLLESERAARTVAEHASRMKDEFLATLSHELRTPLAAVLGWAQILAMNSPMDEAELREGISVIARNARAQAQIIDDLLEMSRIVSGKIRLDVRPLDLRDVVRAAMATIQNAADARRVRMTFSDDDSDLIINGDVNRLQQVFWNLLSNAVKFTPPRGAVDVRAFRVGGHLEVSVTDTGEGIRAEFLPFVFDRFRQADATTTRRHGGLGLGLAIVKQLVELHGGSVRVASAGPGLGSSFTVSLPIGALLHTTDADTHRIAAPAELRGIDDSCDHVAGLRVLLVDDDRDARAAVSRLLRECTAIVTEVSSVAEAIEALDREAFDMLISDIGMPGEDGYSLIRRVRSAGNGVPAIALTAYARPDDHRRALQAGFHAHLSKPADAAELIAAIARLAGRA
jgi:PAS domain S-box-containing protein